MAPTPLGSPQPKPDRRQQILDDRACSSRPADSMERASTISPRPSSQQKATIYHYYEGKALILLIFICLSATTHLQYAGANQGPFGRGNSATIRS